jgi:hypothetical protein
MAEYEANARKMRGLPTLAPGESAPTGMAAYEEAGRHMRGLLPTTQTNQTSLFPFTPPPFKENTRSPIFGSDQEAAYNKKWQDFSRFFSRQGGGEVWPPIPESMELAEREKWAVPGYAEKRLAEERAKEGTISLKGGPPISPVVGVFPGYERTYYEAHPEERMMELIAEQNKPTTDAMQKALEEARTKSQGFGLMGLTPTRAAAERLQASKDVAALTQALTQATAREEATGPQYLRAMEPTPTKPFTPHLVQTSTGEYVWATPGGVLPAGISAPIKPEPAVEDQRKWVEIGAKMKAGEPVTEAEKNWYAAHKEYKELAPTAYGQARIEMASLPKPTTTPGITYSPKTGFEQELPDGTKIRLTSDQVKQKALEYKEDIPIADLKTMQQAAPSVLQLVEQARLDMAQTEKDLGPAMSRWRTLWSGKIGAEDVAFRKLYADVGLLQTRLMRMHVGARGGVQMLDHFKTLFDAAKDDPKNLKGAFDSIELYAREVMKPLKEQKAQVGAVKEIIINGKRIIEED